MCEVGVSEIEGWVRVLKQRRQRFTETDLASVSSAMLFGGRVLPQLSVSRLQQTEYRYGTNPPELGYKK